MRFQGGARAVLGRREGGQAVTLTPTLAPTLTLTLTLTQALTMCTQVRCEGGRLFAWSIGVT